MIPISQILIATIAVFNIVAFALVYIDKRKSINNSTERVAEITFFVWSIFFSSLGVLAGMFAFRHKTQKLNFVVGIGLLLIQQLALIFLILERLQA
jgi:uncharacterized membrane protein YsdA (DUF1294 family)